MYEHKHEHTIARMAKVVCTLSSRQLKKQKIYKSCNSCEILLMLFHRSHYIKLTLIALVVIIYICCYHFNERFFTGIFHSIISLTFQYSPKALHWPIVQAFAYPRHTLCHFSSLYLLMKIRACVLKATIAVEKRMGIGVRFYCLLKGLKDQFVVVAVSYLIRDYPSIIKIQNGAQIQFLLLSLYVILEFRNICQPFNIRLFECVK